MRQQITQVLIVRLVTIVSELVSVNNKPQQRYLSALLASLEHDGNAIKVSVL